MRYAPTVFGIFQRHIVKMVLVFPLILSILVHALILVYPPIPSTLVQPTLTLHPQHFTQILIKRKRFSNGENENL